jgi:hypothetical protein
MRLRISIGSPAGLAPLPVLHELPSARVEGDRGRVLTHQGRVVGVFAGEALGWRTGHDEMSRISSDAALAALVASHAMTDIAHALEGRFVLVKIDGGAWQICTDRFGQADVYYTRAGGRLTFATALDLLPAGAEDQVDDAAVAHAITVYGYRPPKRHTFYAGIRRLGVGEIVSSGRDGEPSFDTLAPRLPASRPYGPNELKRYADLLLDAVDLRASDTGNVVYLSSGWDSTSILGALVHLRGAAKVRAVIGRMNYATRSGIINQFEIDRARAVAEYYKVPLEVVELDYWQQGQALVDDLRPTGAAHMLGSMTYFNHSLLARHVAATARGGESVFAGEISDGAHNLGFSQFVTIFHPVLEFREYSDKMASYLFGPTFLGQLQQGTFRDDVIYDLLRRRMGNAVFDEPASTPEGVTRQLLASFFLRGSRFPMWSLDNVRVLTAEGRARYDREIGTYLDAAGSAGPDTLYAWYLHLYNSFHWQGGTVSTLATTADRHGLRMHLPFWDSRLIDFLSAMPESWGRGLDLKPTKYPLKWTLEHVIDYPLHLQVGPHSYLYDVDPSFSHSAEFLYGSALKPAFVEMLTRRGYRDMLSPSVFDLGHIDGIVDGYLSGREVRGLELNELAQLTLTAATAWKDRR